MAAEQWHLFDVTGIEIEFMIAHDRDLAVAPLADQLLAATGTSIGGDSADEFNAGAVSWTNELALHVIELKGSGPFASLDGVAELFHRQVQDANALLDRMGAGLLPGAMHPLMNPATESRLWPHGQKVIYQTFDRIFNCSGHGWSNLQSTHINLPFCGDEEFGRLHAAIRLLLPLLPALAASSPVMDGAATGFRNNRLRVYRDNCARVPEVTGDVIPEALFSIDAYHGMLENLAAAIAPLDHDHVLEAEWLNARGAIARFDRNAIEIRVLDCQETPLADIAMVEWIVSVLRMLVEETTCGYADQKNWRTDQLLPVYDSCVEHAERAQIRDKQYLSALGITGHSEASAAYCWQLLAERAAARGMSTDAGRWAEHVLRHGTLSSRMLAGLGAAPDRRSIEQQSAQLVDCLAQGRFYAAT